MFGIQHGLVFLADLIVALHVVYVGSVILGLLAVLIGGLCRWQWVRNFSFRAVHFTMMFIVAVESLLRIECPLTTWENDLRRSAGQTAAEGTFVGRMLDSVLFYQFPDHVFTMMYVSFALLIAASFYFVPPRLPVMRSATSARSMG